MLNPFAPLWQLAALFAAAWLIASPGNAAAGQTTLAPELEGDLAFVVDILREDYAGFPDKTAGERATEFEAQVELARTRLKENPEARIWAYVRLLDWFEDDHLTIRSKIVSPDNPWPPEDPGRSRIYSPMPSNEFEFRRLSDETVMVRVPDFAAENAEVLADLLAEHHETIISTPNLLIDLRDNRGGSDFVYEPLMAYLYTRPIYQIGVELRDTPRNLAAMRGIMEGDDRPQEIKDFIANVLERAAVSDEEFVPLLERGFQIETFPQVYAMPARVGILGEGAASSGDQFVIDARASSKVTLLGGPTAGIIDYSNVVTATAPSGDFAIGWPMTRSMRLPHEPLDNVGVPADVVFGPEVEDEIAAAQAWLERQAD